MWKRLANKNVGSVVCLFHLIDIFEHLDENLSWKSHVSHIASKISISVGIIGRSSPSLTALALKTMYYSLVYPYFQYCIIVWGSTYPTNLNHLILLQKRITRIVNKKPFDAHTDPLFKPGFHIVVSVVSVVSVVRNKFIGQMQLYGNLPYKCSIQKKRQIQLFVLDRMNSICPMNFFRTTDTTDTTDTTIWKTGFRYSKFLKFVDIYSLRLGKFVYSYNNNLLTSSFSNFLLRTNQVHCYNTRGSAQFYIPFCRTNIRKFSMIYHGPVFFNKLCSDIRNSLSLYSFQSKIKKYFLSCY